MALLYFLPNTQDPLIASVTLALAEAVLNEASLSFLGEGIEPPRPSWGIMCREGMATST